MSNIEQIYSIFKSCKSINTDTRIKQPNSLFFALKGENFDGNKFVQEAFDNGCKAAVVSDPKLKNMENVFLVEDTLKTLQKLANYHRKKLGIPILAITGTNGKTTTKDLISSVMAQKLRVSYTSGNKNNHIGVPLTILAMNHTVDFGIIEMGANHQGEIKTLCEITDPDYGLITNIGKAHLEGFGSIENIKQTKGELYEYLKQKNGVIFSNIDNPILNDLLSGYESFTYGASDKANCVGTYKEVGLKAIIEWQSSTQKGIAKSNLIGDYNFENILAAITIGVYFKVPGTAIDQAISSYNPRNNRSQLVKTLRNSLILDFYNANPTSMSASIDNFNKIKDRNKCLILGDMLELGNDSADEHKKILDKVESSNFRKIFLVGKEFYKFNDKYEFKFFKNVEDLAGFLVKHPEISNFFLIKGSRGVKLEKCVDYL